MDDRSEARDGDPRFEITAEEALVETLRAVLIEADSNGVEVEGSWPVLRDDGESWDVEVTRLDR